MARIDVLPSIEIIRGFKGILDFYVWRGLPCVRAWPQYRPARQTDASKASALLFGAIIKAYALLANQALLAYREDALDQPRTARDIMVTGVYGNLHEASMTDFLDALIICRDSLVALTDLLHALHSIDTDEIVVRTEHSVLPDGAATAAAQASQLTALQKIDDLQDALESNALDRLLVRGMDQLFTIANAWLDRQSDPNASAAADSLTSSIVGANQYLILTHVAAWDNDTNITMIQVYVTNLVNYVHLKTIFPTAAKDALDWNGWLPLPTGWRVIADFTGTLLNDDIYLDSGGYNMTLEP